jgi:hypothetical protein
LQRDCQIYISMCFYVLVLPHSPNLPLLDS